MPPVETATVKARVFPLVNVPPWALVVGAVLSVQVGAALAKQLFDTGGPGGVVFLRTLFGGAMFYALWRPRLRGHSRQAYLHIAAYGFVIAMMMLAFYASIERIPLGISVAISFAGPLGVAVIGSRRVTDLLWVALAAVGVLLLSPFTNAALDPLGMVYCFFSAALWAVYILLSRRVIRVVDNNTALTFSMCAAAVFALPFGAGGAAHILIDPALALKGVVVALLSSAVPFALEFQALKSLSARSFGLLVSIEPVVATVIGFLWLREAISLPEIIGIGLVMGAVIATARGAK